MHAPLSRYTSMFMAQKRHSKRTGVNHPFPCSCTIALAVSCGAMLPGAYHILNS